MSLVRALDHLIVAACLGCNRPVAFDMYCIEAVLEAAVCVPGNTGSGPTPAYIYCDDCEPLVLYVLANGLPLQPWLFRDLLTAWHRKFTTSDKYIDLDQRQQFEMFVRMYRRSVDRAAARVRRGPEPITPPIRGRDDDD